MTYGDLDREARVIAGGLRSLGASRRPTLLVYPPGLEFVRAWFGCMYAGAVPVVVHPPHGGRPDGGRYLDEAAAIVTDAHPAVALTTGAILGRMPSTLPEPLRSVHWVPTDGPAVEPGQARESGNDSAPTGEDLAFLQYTSGSTSAPRGVMVTHANLMHNLRAIVTTFWRSSDHGSVSWLPPYHDMGLIGGILGPLYVGAPVTLLPPLAFVQRPRRWLEAITRFRGAVSGGPNFAYELCVRRISAEQRTGLDLSAWRIAFNGAEPVNPRTLREFAAHFEPAGFRLDAFKPCYGLAEATLLVSVNATTDPPRVQHFREAELARHDAIPCTPGADARPLASSGQPVGDAVIVDPETLRRCGPGRIGEIWLSGPAVARGYWGQPAQTAETFGAFVCDGDRRAGPFLRTGDLGFLLDGELFVTGRIKDLIIIDGANHYPQDIERTVGCCHPTLHGADCAAFSVGVEGTERLVVVAVARPAAPAEITDLRRAIRTAITERHELRLHDLVLVARGAIAKTPSGKVRRRACRAAYLAGDLQPLDGGPP